MIRTTSDRYGRVWRITGLEPEVAIEVLLGLAKVEG